MTIHEIIERMLVEGYVTYKDTLYKIRHISSSYIFLDASVITTAFQGKDLPHRCVCDIHPYDITPLDELKMLLNPNLWSTAHSSSGIITSCMEWADKYSEEIKGITPKVEVEKVVGPGPDYIISHRVCTPMEQPDEDS